MRLAIRVAVAVSLLSSGCSLLGEEGSGVLVTRTFEVAREITHVEIEDSFVAEVSVGTAPSAAITIDDNLVSMLRVTQDGDTLVLDLDGRVRDATLQANIVVSGLAAVAASGASQVSVRGTMSADVVLVASGSSVIEGAVLDAETLEIDLSGASRIEASGAATRIQAQASGASELLLADVETDEASVEASGASSVEVWVNDELDARASGASSIAYRGDPPRVIVDSSGSSSVERA